MGPSVAIRLSMLGGLVVGVVTLFVPGALVPLSLAYPIGLCLVAVTGGSLDGRRTRPGLLAAATVLVVGLVGVWLFANFSQWALLPWGTVGAIGTGAALHRALSPPAPVQARSTDPQS